MKIRTRRKRTKHVASRSIHGYSFPGADVAASILNVPNARNILQRVVDNDMLWDLLTDLEKLDKQRANLLRRIAAKTKSLRGDL